MKWLAFGVQIVILALSWTTPCSESLLHGHIMCCIIICCSFNDTSMATLAIRTFIQILVWPGSPWQQGVIRSLDHARLVYRYTLLNWANQVNHRTEDPIFIQGILLAQHETSAILLWGITNSAKRKATLPYSKTSSIIWSLSTAMPTKVSRFTNYKMNKLTPHDALRNMSLKFFRCTQMFVV